MCYTNTINLITVIYKYILTEGGLQMDTQIKGKTIDLHVHSACSPDGKKRLKI